MRSIVEARFEIESMLVVLGCPSVAFVSAVLCEDAASIMYLCYLENAEVEPLCALLHLPAPIAEKDFDPDQYIEAFWYAAGPRSVTRH